MAPDADDHHGKQSRRKRKHVDFPNSLDFAAQLTSHLASHSTSNNDDTTRNMPTGGVQIDIPPQRKRIKIQLSERSRPSKALKIKPTSVNDDAVIARSRAIMEEKARKYVALKNGDCSPGEDHWLVDFDRKWAESEEGLERIGVDLDSASNSEDDDDAGLEVIEYEDEFGRLRRGTRSEKEKIERRMRLGALGAQELDRMSARPAAPTKLIYGDVIQSLAFNPEDPLRMEELARNRDRSPTPPPQSHYDSTKEFRTKGVGFYQFSKDEEIRAEEMRSLETTRQETNIQRQEMSDRVLSRREEMERRRKVMDARRAKKLAANFLDSLASGT